MNAAAEALQDSVGKNRQQQALVQESRELLTDLMRGEMRDEMQLAVTEGIRAALTPDMARQFATVFLDAVKQQTNTKMNEVAGGVVRAGLKKLAWFLVAGLIVYSVGGWTALATLGKFFASRESGT